MNLSMISGAWRVFKAGEEVADPAKWKAHQVSANQIVIFLAAIAALAKGAGYDLHLDDGSIGLIAGGVLGLVNWLFTLATSAKVGIGPLGGTVRVEPAAVAGPPGDAAASRVERDPAPVGGVAADASPAPEVRAERQAPVPRDYG